MPLGLVSTRKLVDKKVFGGKDHAKHLGKVKAFIFHPQEKRCVGFVVKRADVALMFHREDLFVAFDAFTVEDDGDIYVSQKTGATGDAACKRLGVDWNTCLVWRGLWCVDAVFLMSRVRLLSVWCVSGNAGKFQGCFGTNRNSLETRMVAAFVDRIGFLFCLSGAVGGIRTLGELLALTRFPER